MEIRQMRKVEAHLVSAFTNRIIDSRHVRQGDLTPKEAKAVREILTPEYFESHGGTTLVAMDDVTIRGAGRVAVLERGVGRFYHVAADGTIENGIGHSMLISELEEKARRGGATRFEGFVPESHAGFFESKGYDLGRADPNKSFGKAYKAEKVFVFRPVDLALVAATGGSE